MWLWKLDFKLKPVQGFIRNLPQTTMSPQQLTIIILLLSCALQRAFSSLRQFRFYQMDRIENHWQRIQHMPCTTKLYKDDFQGIMSCILQSSNDTESFMVGTNASHCILCYYQVNNATLNAVEFQGTLLFKRGMLKLQHVLVTTIIYLAKCHIL